MNAGYGPLLAALAGLITTALGITDQATQGYVKIVLAALGTALVAWYVAQEHKTARNGDTAAAAIAVAAATPPTYVPLPGIGSAAPGVVQADPSNLIPADKVTGTVLSGPQLGGTVGGAGKHQVNP